MAESEIIASMEPNPSDPNANIFIQKEPPKQSIGSHFVEFFQTLVVFAAIASAIYLFVAQPHRVSGLSMYPNFQNSDYIITDKVTYRLGNPQRGDVVVFKNPRDEAQDFIKRVMALPGDQIKVEKGYVYINDKLVKEPYLKNDLLTNPGAYLREGEDVVVTAGHYIVMGDNRNNSSDSREWGEITKAEIIGKVFLRYWPGNSAGLYPAAYSFKEAAF